MPYTRRKVKIEVKESLRYSKPRWWKVELLCLLFLAGLGLSLFLLSVWMWPYAALPGATLLAFLAPCLRFGFQGYCLGTFRSALTGYWNLFSGFRRIGPVFSLALLSVVFCALWSLLPVALGLAVQLLLFAVGGRTALEAINIVLQIRVGAWVFPLWIDPVMYVALLLAAVFGIWKALQYRMAPYFMLDDPHVSVRIAIRKSRAIMRGRCRSLFVLWLGFFGYLLLSALVMAVGAFFCGAGHLAASGAPTPIQFPGVFLETVRQAVSQLLVAGDLRGAVTILTAPYTGIQGGALPALFWILLPLLPPLMVQLRAAAFYTCAEAGFYDSVLEKWQEKQKVARQTSTVWAGFD